MQHKTSAAVRDAAERRKEAAWQLELARQARKNDDLNGEAAALRAAADLLRLLDEEGRVQLLQNRIADLLGLLGRPSEAWTYRIQALAWANRLPPYPLLSRADPKEIQIAIAVLEGAVQASLKQRCPMAAIRFQTRALTLALALKAHDRIVLSWLSIARIEAALGKQGSARRDFFAALSFLPVQSAKTTKRLAALIDTVRSEIEDAEGRAAAITSDQLPSARLDQQANFDLRRGDTAAGERSLERALDALERQRLKVPPGSGRVSYFDQARPIYQRLAALEAHLVEPEKALDVLERFRARFLLDQMGEFPTDGVLPTPLTSQDLIRRLPEHTVLVVYASIDERLVTLLVRPTGVWMSPSQPEMPMVTSWVQRLLEPQVEEVGRGQLLEELHETLIAPWIEQLAAHDRIIFIPTSDFYRLPFAALRNEKSGRFLVEDHPVGVAPSASQFIAAVERDRQRSAKPAHDVLLVGNPSLSSRDTSSALPGSAQEIETLSRLYADRETEVLTRGKATPRRVLTALRQADIIHLSTHSVGDTRDPLRSHLLLSAADGDPGEISARDLHRVRLPKTRLVILASCGSQAGPVSASEGSLSLAYSFLAAGVPAVVGSLWLIDDGDAARISIRFHQELLRGADALTALRTAQREEIALGRPLADWTWASFQVYGGVGERMPARLTP
jgi:CHAT domain-containing protein